MNKQIKRLQKLLTENKIDLAEYKEQLQELLDDEIIKQEDFDQAKDFEPVNEDDKPIYSQEDVNRMITSKARQMVKKALRDAGVDTEGVENKELLTTFGNLALQGQKKGSLTVDEKEVADLKKKAKSYDDLQPQVKKLTIENAVLKSAGELNPLNPKQVVRALDDYKEYLEYDEDENLVPKSVDRALKELAKAEPNLFKTAEAGEGGAGSNDPEPGFKGKSPGGAGAGDPKPDKKQEELKAKALEMMGLSKKQ